MKLTSHRLPLCSALLAFALCAGCGSAPKRSPAETKLLDDRVTSDRVELALRRDGQFDYSHVQVRAGNGVVFLSGAVASREAIDHADQVARGVARGSRLENRLTVWQQSNPQR